MGRVAAIALLLLAVRLDAELRRVTVRDLERPRVARVRIEHLRDKPLGNKILRAAMLTRAGERFQHRFFRADLSTIEDLYRGQGYMDVEIVRRQFFLDEDGRLHIHLRIDSGLLWHVAQVAIELADSTVESSDLREQLGTRVGEVFRYGKVIDDERGLLAHLNGRGFAHARVRNRLELDARRRQASVFYQVSIGQRMVFGPIRIEGLETLQTRSSLILRQLTFGEGQLYDPAAVRTTRNQLARTGLFRSVTLSTPAPAGADSVQPVYLRLQERPFLHLGTRLFVNNSEPSVSGNAQHSNFLGRGNRIGVDASFGRPLQGLTPFVTERNVLESRLDLTLSAGVTDEWAQTRVFADPQSAAQRALLTTNHTTVSDLQARLGDAAVAAFVNDLAYGYASVERLWEVSAVLGKRWEPLAAGEPLYLASLTANWTASRNRPVTGGAIELSGAGAIVPDAPTARAYDDGRIPVDAAWRRLLTDRARALNFELELQRDTRDNQIAPSQGDLLRAAGLFAWEFSGGATRVLDGEIEARNYLGLGDRIVWAQAVRAVLTGSLRRDRRLPQAYWKAFGGEGSVRGVERASILAAGGGRAGVNVRNELRLRVEAWGVVLFWDRAGVWRRGGEAAWRDMTDGYGTGLRWDPGIPLRLDLGWSRRFAERALYFSVGQAF